MKIFIFCLLMMFASVGWCAELLVKAEPNWKDKYTQADIDKLTPDEKIEFDARSQVGDVIVVKPDGWKWGKEECLPKFVVIKIPNVSIDDVKYLEQYLMEDVAENPRILKRRQYTLGKTYTDSIKDSLGGTASITKFTLDTKVVDKSK